MDVGGRDPTAKTTHWIIHLSTLPQYWIPHLSVVETICLDRLQTRFIAYILEYSPPCVHSRDECSQAFPVFFFFFVGLPLPCIIVNANGKVKMGEAWEQGYTSVIPKLLGRLKSPGTRLLREEMRGREERKGRRKGRKREIGRKGREEGGIKGRVRGGSVSHIVCRMDS